MKGIQYVVFCLLTITVMPADAQVKSLFNKKNKYHYPVIDTEEMIRRFVSKTSTNMMSIEVIYSVSSVVVKKGKSLLSNEVKEKIVDRRDNYARVAIMRDWSDSRNEFIQVSLGQTGVTKFPIVGQLTTLSEGRGFLYKHTEPDGEVLTFTFTYAGDSDLLEGTYTKIDGSKTITYTITLLKTFPKTDGVTAQ